MMDQEFSTLETAIRRLLRGGVALCGLAFGVGLLLWFQGSSSATVVLDAGLVVLMAIPVARIVASFIDALRRGDRLLAFATGTVLLIMLATVFYSALSGHA